jgi:hypothetical protein
MWDVASGSLLEVHWPFGGMYCFHLQGSRIKRKMEIVYSSKMLVNFIGLHSLTSQKIVLLIITTVRTSNPTYV